MTEPEWLPIVAVRGFGMLIRGRRVGIYNMMQSHRSSDRQAETHWAIFYLILTADEWDRVNVISTISPPPTDISYVDIAQPECATVTRSYLTAREVIYGTEDLRWVGCYLPWRDSAYTHEEIQPAVLEFSRWVDKCLES